MANQTWINHFQEASVEQLVADESNHSLIFFMIAYQQVMLSKLFHFLKAWTLDESNSNLVEKLGSPILEEALSRINFWQPQKL